MLQTPLSFLLHMDSTESNNHHFHIRGAMPVPVLEDSDNESSLSSEDTASLTELVSGQFARGAADEVKLELRNAIRSRRVAKGLDEMPNCDAKRPKIEQLSAEEEEKRRIRRERNKVAASKCRQRRKEHMTTLQLESDGLDKENSTLESEIAALKEQKEQLEEMFREHICQLKKKNNPHEDESAKSPDTCSAEASKMKDSISPCSPSVDLSSSQA